MINIAIDGPAGAGKSTVAKGLAKELGFIYVDTGALYRTVGLNCLRKNIVTTDPDAVSATLSEIKVELRFIDGAQKVFLNDEDVSEAIRTPDASMAASHVSAIPSVREFLFDLQKDIAEKNNCIMDGRDIGTVVLPNAQVKIFMSASAEKRADRRFKELQEKGSDTTYQEVLDDIIKRDYNDSHREIAPLKPADDAVLLDTSDYNLEESVEAAKKICIEKMENYGV